MIKRKYFFSCIKPYKDGTGSYSHYSCTVERRSFFENSYAVYQGLREHATEDLDKYPGENIEVISFNRI